MSDALHVAVRNGNIEKIKEMLEKETKDVNGYSPSGMTPLQVAASSGNEEVASLLLSFKALVNQRAEKGTVYDGYSSLHFAAERPQSAPILSLLIQTGGDTKAEDSLKRFPLHVACLKGNLAAVKILAPLAEDSINHKDDHGRTSLMLACSQGHHAVVQYLINCKGISLDLVDNDGNSSLHHCFQIQSQPLFNFNYPLVDGHYDSAFELAKAGVSLLIKNKEGDMALDVIQEPLAELLEVVSIERANLGEVTSLEELISLDVNELQQMKVTSTTLTKCLNAIEAYSKVKERELALRKTRGSCPFVDSNSVPEIRKFKEKKKLQLFPPPSGDMGSIKPNHNQFQEYQEIKEGASCPMGYTGAKPTNHEQMLNLSPLQLQAIIDSRKDNSQIWTLVAASAIGAALFAVGLVAFQRFSK